MSENPNQPNTPSNPPPPSITTPPAPDVTPSAPAASNPYEASEVSEPAAQSLGGGTEANFKDRALAFLVDAGVVIGINIAVAITAIIVGFVSSTLGGLVGSLAWLVGVAYLLLRDSLPFLNGLSIGKQLMKIRAVTEDGRP